MENRTTSKTRNTGIVEGRLRTEDPGALLKKHSIPGGAEVNILEMNQSVNNLPEDRQINNLFEGDDKANFAKKKSFPKEDNWWSDKN